MKRFYDLRKEEVLQKDWSFTKIPSQKYASGLLVIGATSFIGAQTLTELFKIWENPIHVLVRAENVEAAKKRMDEIFAKWQLPACQHNKLTYHVGDVLAENWGLSEKEYFDIQKSVGFVVHFAIYARYHLPYSHFKKEWLPDFLRMMDYCSNPDYPKSFHYPSSYSSHFLETDKDFERLNTSVWHSGYTGFKWVTEQILRQSISANFRGAIYDIPLVIGSVKNGIGPDAYFTWQVAELFIKTGIYIDFNFKVISVDVLAKIIAQNLLNDLNNCASTYVRPVFPDAITQDHFLEFAQKRFNLRHGTVKDIIRRVNKPGRVSFIMPDDFYEIIERVHKFKHIYPLNLDTSDFPTGVETWHKNLEYLFPE